MSRELREIAFTIGVMVIIGLAVWDAQVWSIKARLFPWAIGFPLLALLAMLLFTQVMKLVKSRPGEVETKVLSAEETVELAAERRRAFSIVGWLLGFLAGIWLIGFPAAGTLGTFAYLKIGSREKWPISLAISGGTALFFLLMIKALNTPFPAGYVQELLNMPQLL